MNITHCGFKHPVPAQIHSAGGVIRGCHISGSHLRQPLDEVNTGGSAGDVTTVKQKIPVCAERTANPIKDVGRFRQRLRIQRRTAQVQTALATVTEQMNRINTQRW